MAKKQRRKRTTTKAKPALIVKVSGPDIRAGRIPVPDLLVVCQHAQSAVNRQAEALEGRTHTLRPGPKIGKVVHECTLDLVSLSKGSATLGFDHSQAQPALPAMRTLGLDAITKVGEALHALSKDRKVEVDPGVLDSLNSMAGLLANGVRSIQWVVPARPGQRRLTATLNKQVQRRVSERLKPPKTRSETVDGVLEMADFKLSDQKCRIHPPAGAPISCTFGPSLADEIQANMRLPVRVLGTATINAQTDRIEEVAITHINPLEPLAVNAGSFFRGWTFDQLVGMQGVEPIRNVKTLAGGWPADEDIDEFLAETYQHRD